MVSDLLPHGVVPHALLTTWMIWAWNVGVVVVAVSFFFQDASWAPAALGVGATVLVGLWAYHLARITQLWRAAVSAA